MPASSCLRKRQLHACKAALSHERQYITLLSIERMLR